MAGPGTGKSFALKQRIARLLREGCNPERILVVTLTRNAAKDLLSDLRGLGVTGCDKLEVGTLHGFCLKMLRRRGILEGTGRGSRMLMKFEDKPLLKDIGFKKGGRMLKAFEADWARLQHEVPGWPSDPSDKAFHSSLQAWLTFHRVLRVGEVVPLALHYLRNNPMAEELSAFDHVEVDEYQDLNRAEQEILALLAKDVHFAIVGDEDQSIYGFRHAHPLGIRDFAGDHPGTQDEQLDECRRCPKAVVAMADALIRNNYPPTTTVRLKPFPDKGDGDIALVQWMNMQEEIIGITRYVKKLIADGKPAQDVMILCPSKDLGREIRNSLRAAEVNAHSFYAEHALDAKEAQLAFSLLTLLKEPDDRVAMRFLLGIESTTFLRNQYSRLRSYCEAHSISPREALEGLISGSILISGMKNIMARYSTIMREVDAAASLTGSALAEKLFPSAAEWARPVRDIIDRSLDESTQAEELHDWIVEACIQPELPSTGEFVRIMSLHKSKGLSSPVVIVASCLQGVIPRFDESLSDEGRASLLEEQRRLFYVALTRAKETLVISSSLFWPRRLANKMKVHKLPGGDVEQCRSQTSQFVGELGQSAPPVIMGMRWLDGLGC